MADVIVTSAGATSATENELILSIVQDELLKAAKLRPTITDYSAFLSKGDKQINAPKFTTSFTGPQDQNPDGETPVDFQSPVFGVDVIAIDDWVNLPYAIPDRVSEQSKVPLEAELAKSAGKFMGNYIDDEILAALRLASSASPDHQRGLDGGVTSGAGAFALATISTAQQLLDEQNVEAANRWMVIPPALRKTLVDLDDFKNAGKYGSREALLTGEIGEVYGFRVMVHNGAAANECFFYHPEAAGIAMQQDIKFESQRGSVQLQRNEYSFTLGMGSAVLNDGKMNVYCLGA